MVVSDSEGRSKRICLYIWLAVVVSGVIVILAGSAASRARLRDSSYHACRSQSAAEYSDVFIVTVATKRNFPLVKQLVSSAQELLPTYRIAVYTVDLESEDRRAAESWWNVAVFPLRMDRYPRHTHGMETGLYKLLALSEATVHLGPSMFVEPGYRLTGLTSALMKALPKARIVCGSGPAECGQDALGHFSSGAQKKLAVEPKALVDRAAAGTGFVLAVAHSKAVQNALMCALDRACVPRTCAPGALLAYGSATVPSAQCPAADPTVLAAVEAAVVPVNGSGGGAPVVRCADSLPWLTPAEHDHLGDRVDGSHHTQPEQPSAGDKGTEPSGPRSPQPAPAKERPAAAQVPTAAQIAAMRLESVSQLDAPMTAALNGYTGYTLITSGNAPFFERMSNLVGSAHFWMPDMPIIVYDLGLSDEQASTASRWRNVQVRKFDFSKYPPHFGTLQTYAFKPTIMLETVQERFKILYLDAGMEIRRHLKPVFDIIDRDGAFFVVQEGLTTNMMCCGTVGELTVPATTSALGVDRAKVAGKRMCAGGIQGYWLGSRPYHDVLVPTAACAAQEACIAPPGASLANHRFDQSVFSVQINSHGLQCQDDPIFWGNERNLRVPPTADETQQNDSVLYTARGRQGNKYIRHIKLKDA